MSTVTLARINDAMHMRATNADGHTADLDGSAAIGGVGAGLRPMEMLLASLGACSSIDIVLILKKQRQRLDDLRLRVEAQRGAGKKANPFTAIHVHFDMYGDIKENKAEQAVRMSMEEYCSVAKMLEQACPITHSFTVHAAV